MDITELNILNNFQNTIKSIQNPSLISQFQLSTFCKWGALLIALLATFTTIINKLKLLFFHFPTVKSLTSSSSFKHLQQILDYTDQDFDFIDEDSSSSESEFDDQKDEDFRVKGSIFSNWSNSFKLRHRRIENNRFSWSDFAAGKSVVQLWDGFGLGLDFDDDSFDGEDSIWDSDSGQNFPDVVFSAELGKNDSVLLSGYDKRVSCRTPAIYADWKKIGCRVVNVKPGGVDKIYVKDGDTGGITVGDIRNVKTPLENLTDDDDDSWWDADGVTF